MTTNRVLSDANSCQYYMVFKDLFSTHLSKKKVCNFPSAVLDEFEQSVVAWTGLRGRMKERSVCCMYTFTNFKPGLENPNQVGDSTSGF